MTEPASHEGRIQAYYGGGDWDEDRRLTHVSGGGRVEFLRVQELVRAELAPASRVLDVGGATGVHARWLAEDGHDVLLIDPVPEQVARAAQTGSFRAVTGDARELDVADASVDAVLLFGPLYHLPTRDERVLALREARRVLVAGGVVMAQGVTRLAAFCDRVLSDGMETLGAPDLDILRTGDWSNSGPGFPGGHFHTASELRDELAEAGFDGVEVTGVEGPNVGALSWFTEDEVLQEAALTVARRAGERATRRREALSIADLSGHVFAIGRVPTHEANRGR